MNKEMLELSRAIQAGVRDGIVSGYGKIGKINAVSQQCKPGPTECAMMIKDYCAKTECNECEFGTSDHTCLISRHAPHNWDL